MGRCVIQSVMHGQEFEEREDEVIRKVYEKRLMTYRTTPYPVGGALLKLPWKVTKASPIQSRGKEGVGVSLLPTGKRLGK